MVGGIRRGKWRTSPFGAGVSDRKERAEHMALSHGKTWVKSGPDGAGVPLKPDLQSVLEALERLGF
jgi:hypothetical protein